MTETKLIMEHIYSDETFDDFLGDLLEDVDAAKIPQDDCGFYKGTFKITVVWENDDE